MASPIPARRTISMAGHGLVRQKVWMKSAMEVSTFNATTRSPVSIVRTQASVPSSCCWAASFDKFDLGICKTLMKLLWVFFGYLCLVLVG